MSLFMVINKRLKTMCFLVPMLCVLVGCDQGPNFYKYNFQVLALQGALQKAEIKKVMYNLSAPDGWAIYYSFNDEKGNVFKGMSMGPKSYIQELNPGDGITIVYLPEDPRINLAFFYLLKGPEYKEVRPQVMNNPLFKEEIRKVHLEDFSSKEWRYETRLE